MNVAVIGSRTGFKESFVRRKLFSIGVDHNERLITGGAKGIDKIAEEFAKDVFMDIEIIRPINPANKIDYLFRNIEIITKADYIVAFWNGKSKGTKFTIEYAKKRNKKIEIIMSE